MNPLCIYHGNCADGFGAAWAVWKALDGAADFHPGFYNQGPPDVTGRNVVIVDFSYKRDVLLEMGKVARSLLILDHHKSAADDLDGLGCDLRRGPWDPSYAAWGEEVIPYLLNESLSPLGVLFDMDRSGAGITWDFFHDTSRPPLIDHIEDRDLWRYKLDGTREIQAALFSHPYDMELWDALITLSSDPESVAGMIRDGEAIMRKQLKDTAELIEAGLQWWRIGGHRVPVINLPYTMGSEAGHMLLDQHPDAPFVGYHWDKGTTRYWGLRSRGDFDVAEVAKEYGGGGHATASGFELRYGAEHVPIRDSKPLK